ncbi:hypothetical protein FCI23_46360 [Actinacidiphila oryziradicis]|uniref:Uncharacterized protein n=1 Tax=Actinacidiphila oryziradicis TaxID=2571141 RepID=A0A4U0RT43_9ACTN|nr:hypothetical protein FCI23_46360 [Actinacidiphila oryziradicis]
MIAGRAGGGTGWAQARHSGRAMLAALIDGERDVHVLAQMAKAACAPRSPVTDRRRPAEAGAAEPENRPGRPVRRSSPWTPAADQPEHPETRAHQPARPALFTMHTTHWEAPSVQVFLFTTSDSGCSALRETPGPGLARCSRQRTVPGPSALQSGRAGLVIRGSSRHPSPFLWAVGGKVTRARLRLVSVHPRHDEQLPWSRRTAVSERHRGRTNDGQSSTSGP